VNVLIIAPQVPYPLDNGGSMRMYYLLRHLARRHRVVLMCPGPLSAEAAAALRFCAAVEAVPPPRRPMPWLEHLRGLAGPLPASSILPFSEGVDRLRDLLSAERFDLVQIEFLALAHLVHALPDRLRRVLVEHVIASEARSRLIRLMPWGVRRAYYTADLLKLRHYEPAAVRSFDACITMSSRDERLVRTWAPGITVTTIPNGVDTEYFAPAGTEDPFQLMFLGSFHLDYANVDAAMYFAREIFPRIRRQIPEARLTVVGPRPQPEVQRLARIQGIEVTGRVDDVRPYLARAALLVIPLRGGSGTKVRIFTAMAMQKSVLATSIAAEGIDAIPGEEIVIADGTERFADEAVSLLRDAYRRKRIGRAARALTVAQYDWRVIGNRLEALHASLLDRPAHPLSV
jgi:polysaccharide biosynthesis protein PslH